MSADELMTRVNEAKSRHQEAQNQLNEVSGALKGIFIGMELARRQLPRSARDVLRLTRPVNARSIERLKLGISGVNLEAILGANEWTRTTLINPKDGKKGKPTISQIWRSPTGNESIRLTPKKGLIGVRGFNGPYGGAGGYWFQELPYEHALDIKGNTIPAGKNKEYPNKDLRTHFQVSPGSRVSGIVRALDNAPIRGLSRALGPLGAALDTYSLYEAYESDGGRMGENFKETAGGVVGGIAGGVAVGAAMGSVVPVVGTVVGGIVGGIVGSMGGGWLGDKL